MEKILIILSEKEIMEFVNRPRSTYYHWKKKRPEEYRLVKEALLIRKLQSKINESVNK